MGKKKSGILKKIGKGALSLAPAPVRLAAAGISKVVGGGGGFGGSRKRKSNTINVNRFYNRIMRAKLNAKIQKIKFSQLKGL